MDNQTNTIKEYLTKLPPVARECILSDEWQKRSSEIADKYGLNQDQAEKLKYEILFVALGIEPEEDFVSNLTTEIGISELVAEQIASDTEKRLLSWVDKIYINSKKEGSEEKPLSSKKEDGAFTTEVPDYNPRPKVIINNDLAVQSPIAVPRFTAVPLDEGDEAPDLMPLIRPKPNASGIMEAKLNSTIEKASATQENQAKKYTVDPYREPIN